MAWIKVIKENEATNLLKKIYDRLMTSHSIVDNILKIHSLNPRSLQMHYDFYKTIVKGQSGLSRAQREMIAVVVSVINKCHY